MDCVKINMVALLTGGVINLMIPFFTNYYVLASFATVFGLCMGKFKVLYGQKMFYSIHILITTRHMNIITFWHLAQL